jgi:multisubunit Na+/H+ antiporter MnhE subunit
MRLWLAHLILLPLCVWALVEVFSVSSAKASVGVATWLIAAVVVHDFVILPLYSGADRVIRRNNYIRIPGAISLLMLVVFWGTIAGRGERAYHSVSGRTYDGYATRWLLVTAALFAGSGLLYLVRRGSGGRRRGR